ncbi:hypothetical protein BOO92_19540 [Vibrio navarrensis]|uniref:hypothetical protein n=1 Tax=Vibrio navarrensis TaxID=29495 RepID=UPI001865C1D2|nr:hypothetical protein [Vibrio navarrensis]MBE3658867.1 hypothetical protein [Vibrio navarrensis]
MNKFSNLFSIRGGMISFMFEIVRSALANVVAAKLNAFLVFISSMVIANFSSVGVGSIAFVAILILLACSISNILKTISVALILVLISISFINYASSVKPDNTIERPLDTTIISNDSSLEKDNKKLNQDNEAIHPSIDDQQILPQYHLQDVASLGPEINASFGELSFAIASLIDEIYSGNMTVKTMEFLNQLCDHSVLAQQKFAFKSRYYKERFKEYTVVVRGMNALTAEASYSRFAARLKELQTCDDLRSNLLLLKVVSNDELDNVVFSEFELISDSNVKTALCRVFGKECE